MSGYDWEDEFNEEETFVQKEQVKPSKVGFIDTEDDFDVFEEVEVKKPKLAPPKRLSIQPKKEAEVKPKVAQNPKKEVVNKKEPKPVALQQGKQIKPKREHKPKEKKLNLKEKLASFGKKEDGIIQVIKLPMWKVVGIQALVLIVGLLLGFLIGHTPQKSANDFPQLKYESTYAVSSIRLGQDIRVEFQEYSNGSYGKTIKFQHQHKDVDDPYYKLFKYYLKEGDIVVHTDRGDLNRINVDVDDTDIVDEDTEDVSQENSSEDVEDPTKAYEAVDGEDSLEK